VTDAIASALAESACDEAERLIFEDNSHTPRFSPGYGDLPLEIQKPLLSFLDAEKTVGITLSSSLLMTPTKSITAIAGIK
jgi:cobalamin-dependent methionine synthase I